MHTGMNQTPGGRIGEAASNGLSESIRGMGVRTRRLKTGTPARLKADSIDYSAVEVQHGDPDPSPFSFRTRAPLKNHAVCWITHTNLNTHEILRGGFDRSPMFTGVIKGIGPRYCPSIEDKICRFADKDSHHLFLEPEGLNNGRIYVNGFSSSLPAEIQDQALRTIPGLKDCAVLRYGYAVEYDSVESTQLHPTYACKDIPGLYFAGQVNGTSGYEEAAAQGLMAGINAAMTILERPAFLLGRSESYIGVLTDDLVSLELEEPYRMFTSRAEYRLHLRQDNAEERLLEKGHVLGMVGDDVFARYSEWKSKLAGARNTLAATRAFGPQVDAYLASCGSAALDEAVPALSLLRRPDVGLPGSDGLPVPATRFDPPGNARAGGLRTVSRILGSPTQGDRTQQAPGRIAYTAGISITPPPMRCPRRRARSSRPSARSPWAWRNVSPELPRRTSPGSSSISIRDPKPRSVEFLEPNSRCFPKRLRYPKHRFWKRGKNCSFPLTLFRVQVFRNPSDTHRRNLNSDR